MIYGHFKYVTRYSVQIRCLRWFGKMFDLKIQCTFILKIIFCLKLQPLYVFFCFVVDKRSQYIFLIIFLVELTISRCFVYVFFFLVPINIPLPLVLCVGRGWGIYNIFISIIRLILTFYNTCSSDEPLKINADWNSQI